MQNARQEIGHLLTMAKLFAVQQENALLCYFISMAIEENRTSGEPIERHKVKLGTA